MKSRRSTLAIAALAVTAVGGTLVATTATDPASAQSDEEIETIDDIVNGSDFTDAHGDVLRLYYAFFDRDPDVKGALYWIGRSDADVGLDKIAQNFAVSDEFLATYGQTDDEEFLDAVYNNVLDRETDEKGFNYWLGRLESNGLTRGGVVRWIAANEEFIAAHPFTPANYLGSYTLDDAEFGTQVTVTVDGDTRTMVANALPDHETGEFPNDGNPNTISAQEKTYTFTTNPTYVGTPSQPMTVGVAVNGVKFEPGPAETVSCASGETLRVEALQDIYNLGLDFNNAHVQPTGEYHYHGISQMLADAYARDDDLVHVGFAADGFLIYYSKSDAYASGYSLSTTARTGTDCAGSQAIGGNAVTIEGTTPDGTYTADWVWSADTGDLDSCNGIEIDGTYAYLITNEYPYIGRCLNGEVAGGGGPGGPPPTQP